ncbi:MAG: HAD-IB family hydrolase [Dehalococcoidia bacterium]
MALDESAGGEEIGAFFDVDGTLAASNLVDAYIDFRLRGRRALTKGLWLLGFVPRLPFYALVDRFSRSRFNEIFSRRYQGVSLEELRSWAETAGKEFWSFRLYPEALREIRLHRERGHRIALVTGGLRPMVQPLMEILEADGCVAAEPQSRDGRLTGRLSGGALSGPAKAEETRRLADAWGVDLARSYAYADSSSDRDFLECLGHPVAVNPDRRLRRLAKTRGWDTREWRRRDARRFFPVGRLLKRS